MGTNLAPLLKPEPVKIDILKGRVVAVDAFNTLYQFLTTIRGPDGALLSDSKGRPTSHLVGLFSRTAKLVESGIKPVFVFDGEPPELKGQERQRRKDVKEDAAKKYEEAAQKEDIEEMRKFASRTAVLTKEMVEESKELLDAMGIPTVQAPSEGEAQVAAMVRQGRAFAGVSQDYDSLLHGNPRIIRNLSLTGRRKRVTGVGYVSVSPEMILLSDTLNNLGIDLDGLIFLSILVGTDYNPGGIKGIGPKKALALVQKHKPNYENIFREVEWPESMPSWKEIFDTIKNMPVTSEYDLSWKPVDRDKIIKMLCGEHDFSEERVLSTLQKIDSEERKQKSLGDFFG
ncbi:flap endonuclease-1 [Candidatus Woesearchaeota archaeon]|nr:MAG: flap endonuclease-1 [Candidatus Woesearchaeota archaeon]